MSLDTIHLAARRSYSGELTGALHDFKRSFQGAQVWRALAMNDILGRYRGSILGPFWITITQSAFIVGLGLLYSQLFHVETHDYIPLLANGIILWGLFSTTILEGCEAFVEGGAIIKQTALPLPSFAWRIVARNLIVFAHQLIALVVVAIVFGYLLRIQIWWAIPGLILSMVNVAWIAFIACIACTRFRDVQQVIFSVLQLLFFLTPVIWAPKQAPQAMPFIRMNPFYHMLEVTREPLLGRTPPLDSFMVLAVLAVVGWVGTLGLFAAVRRRIVHYL